MAIPILNSFIKAEIAQISAAHNLSPDVLDEFAQFVLENYKKKEPKPKTTKTSKATQPKVAKIKPLTMAQMKSAIYDYFKVKGTPELKKSGSFKMAIDGMDELNLGLKESWEILYRKFIGILPGEENEQGDDCINGVNIFKYFQPWQVFNLKSDEATIEDIKKAYRDLSRIYHPDNLETGDARIFDRINTMYQSISTEA